MRKNICGFCHFHIAYDGRNNSVVSIVGNCKKFCKSSAFSLA